MGEERLQGGPAGGDAHDHPHHSIVGWLVVDGGNEGKALKQQHQ